MEKPSIKINYPVPLNILRNFKEGEILSYTGRILVISIDNLKKLKRYEQLEESRLVKLSHEFILVGKIKDGRVEPEKWGFSGDLVEYLYLSGAMATIGPPAKCSWFVETVAYFRRVHLVPVNDQRDNSKIKILNSGSSFVSTVELDDFPFYINVSPSGKVDWR